ncbi:hypothetical protein E3O55_04135 [Cryobacterium sp. MDB1-18-2]|nr:hypothetical protein E3O55_04135 [Cryobacterium sp. MDB1-18-2]TFC37009.1 hypothetical protein E3O50_18505 [Cryobacterium sp. MDB1-18-1]
MVSQIAETWSANTGRSLGGDASGEWATVFHPSTSYEDFIEGVRATAKNDGELGDFELVDGFLKNIAALAYLSPGLDFLVLLDELNRANVSRVLGDAMLPMESERRDRWNPTEEVWEGGAKVTLPYSRELFSLPSNLYFLATMNTTDRSVAGLDAALRRRFAFIPMAPLPSKDLLEAIAEIHGQELANLMAPTVEIVSAVNESLLSPFLGADFLVGQSFLFAAAKNANVDLNIALSDELLELKEELNDAQTLDGRAILDAFWVEMGAGTGGSRNQIDLSLAGRADPNHGSAALFFQDMIPVNSSFTIEWDGQDYLDNDFTLYKGQNSNGTWRLNLTGKSSSGAKLSALSRSNFPRRALVFLRTGEATFTMKSFPLPDMEYLATWGAADTAKASTRRFGHLDLNHDVPEVNVLPRLATSWLYSIGPQLIELAGFHGSEAILVSEEREAWVRSRPTLNEAVLESAISVGIRFDVYLATLGLRFTSSGLGLARVVRLEEVAGIGIGKSSVGVATMAA